MTSEALKRAKKSYLERSKTKSIKFDLKETNAEESQILEFWKNQKDKKGLFIALSKQQMEISNQSD